MKTFLILIVLIFRVFTFNGFAQQNKIDSLQLLIKADKQDTTKLIHLNKLSREYFIMSSYDSVLSVANSALQLAAFIGSKTGQPIVKRTTQKYQASFYSNIGLVYRNQGDFPKALDYYLKALKIDEEIKNKNEIAKVLGHIGIIYDNQSDFSKALDFYFKALKMDEELGEKRGIAMNLANIGNVYKEQSDFTKALEFYSKALKLDEELEEKNFQSIVLGNIGAVYFDQKNYPQALVYFSKGMKIAEELGDKNGIASCLSNIGSLYTQQKKYKEAEVYLLKALALDKETGAMDGERDDENNLSSLYEKTGRFQLALEHYKKAIALKDTLFNEEKNKEITRKEMNYEFEKKEAAAKSEQDKKDTITAEEKKKQRLVIYFISIGLVLLLLFIVFIIRGYRQKIQSNANIALKNEEISRQKANIVGQEEERKRIAQELHDGIGGTLAGTKLNLIRINSSNNIPELESIISNLGDICKEIRTISHNLAPPALNSNNSFVYVMHEVIQKFAIPDKFKINFGHSSLDELNNIPKNIQTDIYRIIQELLTNTTKHADAGKVEVELSKQGNELFLLVEDDGKGFDLNANHKGIGLQNIESRVELLNGTIITDSKIGRGTSVNIQIPLDEI